MFSNSTLKWNHFTIKIRFNKIDNRLIDMHSKNCVGKGMKVFIKIRSNKLSDQLLNILLKTR